MPQFTAKDRQAYGSTLKHPLPTYCRHAVIGDKLYVGGGWNLNGDPFDNDNTAKWQ